METYDLASPFFRGTSNRVDESRPTGDRSGSESLIDPDLLPAWAAGQRVGRYEIVSDGPVGQGGMGRVYIGRDIDLDRSVAIKEMTAPSDRAAEFRARFLNESQLPARIAHPNVITIFERGEHEGRFWYAMEYLHGVVSLGDLLARSAETGTPLPIADLQRYLTGCLRALCAIHAAGWWHRDVKPDNILVSPLLGSGESIKLIDFGIAHDPRAQLTEAWMQPGSPRYMAPEALVLPDSLPFQAPEVDSRADQFALGVTFYEAFAGEHPYSDIEEGPGWRKVAASIYADANTYPPPLSTQRPGVHAGLEAVIMRMIERRPEDRYSTVVEALADLDGYRTLAAYRPPSPSVLRARHATPLDGGGTPAPPAVVPWRSRPAPRVVAALAAVAGLVMLALWLQDRFRDPPPLPRESTAAPAQAIAPAEPVAPAPEHVESPARPRSEPAKAPASARPAPASAQRQPKRRPRSSPRSTRRPVRELDPRLFVPGGIVEDPPSREEGDAP